LVDVTQIELWFFVMSPKVAEESSLSNATVAIVGSFVKKEMKRNIITIENNLKIFLKFILH